MSDRSPGRTDAPGDTRAKRVIHLLHIRKTGGTVLWHALKEHANSDRHTIVHHPHGTLLHHVPSGELVIFALRDPFTRFVSGFYCRQREGRPRYNSPWKPGERIAFERFRTPNDLARTLSSPDKIQREFAWAAMGSIEHLCTTLTWLESETYLRTRLPDIFFIGFQETLNDDFERLKQKLGLAVDLWLSDDEVAAHRNPAHLDYHLDDLAVANLAAWYEADQRILDFCRRHAPEINAREPAAS